MGPVAYASSLSQHVMRFANLARDDGSEQVVVHSQDYGGLPVNATEIKGLSPS